MYFFIFELYLLFRIFKFGIRVILEISENNRMEVRINMVEEEIAKIWYECEATRDTC